MSNFLTEDDNEKIKNIASLIKTANGKVTILTGAGISVNSGIPDFRGKTQESFYNIYPPNILSVDSYILNRQEFTDAFFDKFGKIETAKPNRAHDIIKLWEEQNLIQGVITQNVDGLHNNKTVIEFHGSVRRIQKVEIVKGKIHYTDEFLDTNLLSKEAIIDRIINHNYKPDVVLFGEDVKSFNEATEMIASSDLTIVIGTRLEVYPFSDLPKFNKKRSHKVVIINNEEIACERSISMIGDAAEILEKINTELNK